jgi:hypothetical protein
VRQLARAQDGEVTADGREGGGTVMRVRLRRADAADRPVAASSAASAARPASG